MRDFKNIYFKLNETTGLAFNRKAGSSSLSRALALITPEVRDLRVSFPDDGKGPNRVLWQSLCPKIENPDTVILPFREPVARFISAMQFIGRIDVDTVLTAIEGGDWVNPHLLPQSDLILNTTKLYRFPEHLENLATDCGFSLPLPTINEAKGAPLTLSEEQIARVAMIYGKDKDIFDSILTPGQVYVAPTPPPLPPPPPPIPQEVPLWAFRQVLLEDNLLATVQAAVAGNAAATNFLEYGNFVDRSSPALASIAAAIGKSSEEVDAFFIRAAAVRL